jgi:hypothetical protein
MPIVSVSYFEETGRANTEEVFRAAAARADELEIDTIVIASTSGSAGVQAAEAFQDRNLVVISHVTGFRDPDTQELTEENRARIEDLGATVHTSTHILGGVGRAVRNKFETMQVDEIIANALRLMGNGTKVACEITAMAADAGLVRTDRDIIAIAGSGGGSDTAIVVRPANTHHFFDMKVREFICKPRLEV